MFLSDSEFTTHVAASLKVASSDLASYWSEIAGKAHQSAYYDIRGALINRGFSAAQVDAWERGAEFERDIGLWWAIIRGGRPAHIDDQMMEALDRRMELKTVAVEVSSGAAQEPGGNQSNIVSGTLDTTTDRWTKDTLV